MNAIPTILYDGQCNLCHATVGFIQAHNKTKSFLFLPLQSIEAQRILPTFGYPTDNLGSVILIEDGKIFDRSTAALKMARYLDSPYHLLTHLMFIPAFIRNYFYSVIARHRIAWFGKRDH